MAYAFFKIAITAEDPRLVCDLRLLRGKRKACAHGNALTERTGGNFNARHKPALGVTRATRTPLTETLKLIHRNAAHPGKVEESVNESACVAARENKPVTAGPLGILRIDIEKLKPQHKRKICHSHRSARVPGIGLFNHIRTKATDSSGRKSK